MFLLRTGHKLPISPIVPKRLVQVNLQSQEQKIRSTWPNIGTFQTIHAILEVSTAYYCGGGEGNGNVSTYLRQEYHGSSWTFTASEASMSVHGHIRGRTYTGAFHPSKV